VGRTWDSTCKFVNALRELRTPRLYHVNLIVNSLRRPLSAERFGFFPELQENNIYIITILDFFRPPIKCLSTTTISQRPRRSQTSLKMLKEL